MRTAGKLRLLWPLLALPVWMGVGCGAAEQSLGPNPAMIHRAEANERLRGSWLLSSFRPEVPLEPMFQTLLNAELGHLSVEFDGQNMNADGPGVQATRRYQVDAAQGNFLRVTLFDDRGIAYLVEGQFVGNRLEFRALTSPWRGSGTLERMGR
jgi:hypothetical protein